MLDVLYIRRAVCLRLCNNMLQSKHQIIPRGYRAHFKTQLGTRSSVQVGNDGKRGIRWKVSFNSRNVERADKHMYVFVDKLNIENVCPQLNIRWQHATSTAFAFLQYSVKCFILRKLYSQYQNITSSQVIFWLLKVKQFNLELVKLNYTFTTNAKTKNVQTGKNWFKKLQKNDLQLHLFGIQFLMTATAVDKHWI